MTPPDKSGALRLGPILLTGIGLMLAIAGSLATPQGASTETLPSQVSVTLPDWLIVGAVAALSIASLVFILMILPRPRPRRKKGEDDYEMYHEPRKVPPLLSALLLLLALTPGAMLGAFHWLGRSEVSVIPHGGGVVAGGLHGLGPQLPFRAFGERPSRKASPVTTGLIGTVVLLLGFGSFGFVLWLYFGDRFRRLPGDFAPLRAPLAAAVEVSLDDLRREPDARLAIIRIYQNFERLASDASFPRRPWETPLEFMRAVLGRLPLPASAARSLTELFEIARFSRHPIGGAERERAWQSLIEIRETLDKGGQTPDGRPS